MMRCRSCALWRYPATSSDRLEGGDGKDIPLQLGDQRRLESKMGNSVPNPTGIPDLARRPVGLLPEYRELTC